MSIRPTKFAASAAGRHVMKSLGILALATAGFSMLQAGAAGVTVAWNANPETDIAGYQLSYGTSPGVHPSVINPGTNTTAAVSGLTEGTTYYFVVAAINQAGLQSLPSSEVSYLVPVATANHAPVATSSSLTTTQGTPLPVTLSGTDVDGNTLTFAIVSGPANGTLSGTAPNLTYSPAANFSGTDQFTFQVNDGSLNSNVATVNIGVNALVLGSLANGSFESGYSAWTVTGSAFIESASSSYITTDGVKLASLNGNSISDSPANAVLSQAFATIAGTTYTLAFDMGVIGSVIGEQKLQVTVDGAGNLLSQTASKTKVAGGIAQWTAKSFTFVANSPTTTLTLRDISAVTVGIDTLLDNVRVTGPAAGSNTAPVAMTDSYSTTAGTALVVPAAGVLINDSDAQANPLTAALDAGPSHGSLTLNSNGGFTYTPAAAYAGTDSFTYHANDGTLNSVIATVSIAVISVNTAPVASSKTVTTAQGTPLSITLAGTDPDANSLTFSVVAAPTHGTLTGTAPNLTYSPAANFSGADQFTFVVNDGSVNSAAATISITVTPANSLPLPWDVYQLGTGNLAGTASYSAGVYTIAGSGALGGTQDAANFSWQTLSGDGEITARISNLSDTGTATRVGVMIRESLATNSRQAFIGVNGVAKCLWLSRTSTGGTMVTISSKGKQTAVTWLRLVRTGTTITGYKSSDAITWTTLGTSTATLPANCYIGLAVSSGSNTTLNTSQFSDVTITP